ncbi:MAG TPA: hypothetical protein PLT68_04030 [Actinomycetota bacterium]|nr:hypothetical protein [Actinomycetota bacterium]
MSAVPGRAEATHAPRVAVVGTLMVIAAFVVQTAVLPAVGVPVTVPAVLATVAVLAVAWGRRSGALIGFGAGLLLDLTGTGVLGVGALVGCLLGAAAGLVPVGRWRWSGAGWVVLLVVLAQGADTLLDALLLGQRLVASPAVLWSVTAAGICTVVLLPARDLLRSVVR